MTPRGQRTKGNRQLHVALDAQHLEKLKRLLRFNGIAPAARLLKCSDLVAANLGSGGFALRATIERITAALDALDHPAMEKTG